MDKVVEYVRCMSRDVVSEHPSMGEQLQDYFVSSTENSQIHKDEQRMDRELYNERDKVRELEEKISELVSEMLQTD